MPKWSKEAPQLYLDERGQKYYGVPRLVFFKVENHAITSWLEAEHKLDYEHEPWNQFAPNGEAFLPGGHRKPLPFGTETPMRRSIQAKLRTFDDFTIGKIGPEGEARFKGDIYLNVCCAGGEYDLPPHGTVSLFSSQDNSEDCLHVSVTLAGSQLEALCGDLIARPAAVLGFRVKFACYENETDEMACELNSHRSLLLEVDAHIPIIEVQLSVHDRPDETPPLTPESLGQPSDYPTNLPLQAHPKSDDAIVLRLNWTVALLVAMIIVLFFR